MARSWTTDEILELGRSYQAACVLTAAGELGVFEGLADKPRTAADLAHHLGTDPRATVTLLDALSALALLGKQKDTYTLPPAVRAALTTAGTHSILAMTRHQGNCLRRWAQLARVVRTGRPAERTPSTCGADADAAAFIGAMHNICAPLAATIVAEIQPLEFTRLVDVGGACGTWTEAFLRAHPAATAILFDLPHVIPMADTYLASVGLRERVDLVAGDFMVDPLPPGADLAWVSAIVHQNSRAQNRQLIAAVFAALSPGGRIMLRDVLMEPARTAPVMGALFAINMLVATEGGGTFTFDELREDLASAGFVEPVVLRRDEQMNSIVAAQKPANR
ncbi:MAG: polyketide synthesis methyltransferase [Planctomycetes bacterium]|nr:polyketide synthesis methyltransferase [Planctomycetota bacterium]